MLIEVPLFEDFKKPPLPRKFPGCAPGRPYFLWLKVVIWSLKNYFAGNTNSCFEDDLEKNIFLATFWKTFSATSVMQSTISIKNLFWTKKSLFIFETKRKMAQSESKKAKLDDKGKSWEAVAKKCSVKKVFLEISH